MVAGIVFTMLIPLRGSAVVYPPTVDPIPTVPERTAQVRAANESTQNPSFTGFDATGAVRTAAGFLLLGGFALSATRRRRSSGRLRSPSETAH